MNSPMQTLRWSAWLGWQIESNWTNPYRFAVYLMVRPLAGALLLVAMFWTARTASGDAVPLGFLPFLYIGNACYLLVGAVTFGMTWAVISDREHYGMLKYVRLGPIRLEHYIIGRGFAKGAEGAVGAILTLACGWLFLPEIRAAWDIRWGWLVVNVIVGLGMLVALGLLLAGAVLNMARHGMFLSEGVAGTLYLLSGAIFPVGVLPAWLQPLSRCLPSTYWLEAMRRSLLDQSVPASLPGWDLAELTLASTASTLILAILGHFGFCWCEKRTWRLGRFDLTTGA